MGPQALGAHVVSIIDDQSNPLVGNPNPLRTYTVSIAPDAGDPPIKDLHIPVKQGVSVGDLNSNADIRILPPAELGAASASNGYITMKTAGSGITGETTFQIRVALNGGKVAQMVFTKNGGNPPIASGDIITDPAVVKVPTIVADFPSLPGRAGVVLAALLFVAGIVVFGKCRKEPAT